MSVIEAVRSSLSAQIALKLAGLLLVLMALAGVVITTQQTRQMEQATLEKARASAVIGARQYGDMFD